MTTKLEVYNLALTNMRGSTLVDLTEANESSRTLDAWYLPTLKLMLEKGYWKFAMRSVSITDDATITPAFGPSGAFNIPSDWVKTYDFSLDENFNVPFDDWFEENNLWICDNSLVYVRYVSNADSGYGMDLTRWTGRYTQAVASELAFRACPKATGSSDSMKDDLRKQAALDLYEARVHEAMRDPPKRIRPGRWNAGRFGMNRNGRQPGSPV